MPLAIIYNGFWWRANVQGARCEGLEFVELAEINLLSRGRLRQKGSHCKQQRHSRRDLQLKTHGPVQLFLPRRQASGLAIVCGLNN